MLCIYKHQKKIIISEKHPSGVSAAVQEFYQKLSIRFYSKNKYLPTNLKPTKHETIIISFIFFNSYCGLQ
jgi:hypothetical protein